MKKNIDKDKISNFKKKDFNFDYFSSFCMKTKPNKRYYTAELKRITKEFLDSSCGQQMKQEDPLKYYSIKGQKPPKHLTKPKYPIAPVNAYVPEQSILSKEELDRQIQKELDVKKAKDQKTLAAKKLQEKEAERQRLHKEAVAREKSIIFVCNAHENHNWTSIHSEAYQKRYNKKYIYY